MLAPELLQQFQSLMQARRLDELSAVLGDALALYPGEPDVHHLLGWTRWQQRRADEAVAHLREAIRLQPDAVGSLTLLGSILVELERLGEAIDALKAALTHRSTHVPALTTISLALCRAGLIEHAVPFLEAALQLESDNADAHHYLAFVLMTLGRLDAAERHAARALELRPGTSGYLSTYGLIREKQHRPAEATQFFQQAVAADPQQAEPWSNLGMSHAAIWGNYQAARECFERALALRPQFVDARYHLGMVELTVGDFERGWANYESRPTLRQKPRERYRQPRWRGESLAGKTILTHAEQGLGDTLQFVRYCRVLKERGARVIAEVQKTLVPLLARTPGIDLLLSEGSDLSPHDFQIALLSVPSVVGIAEVQGPYLFADPERVAQWKPRLASLPGFKIGIAWQGDAKFKYDWLRSVPLAYFAHLTQVPGVTLVSLQKNLGVEQIAPLRDKLPLVVLEPEIDSAGGAFLDTAAIMTQLDLVISSDTSLAHLAGGLGVPIWLATALAPDWRWQAAGETTPWYHTMRLFRQTSVGDWSGVFERMAAELRALVAKTGRSSS